MDIETFKRVLKDENVAGGIWVAILSFATQFYAPLVLMNFWNWFIADVIHAGNVSYWQAVGLLMFVYVVKFSFTVESRERFLKVLKLLEASVPAKDDKSDWKSDLGTELGKIFAYTLALVLGWGLHTFLM
jgi:hypothetical protein